MLVEVDRFDKWLRRRSPNSSTHVHYSSDLRIFFTWLDKLLKDVTASDVDRFIAHCSSLGHAVSTINRRLAAIRSFFEFLAFDSEVPPKNPVIPRRHYIRQGVRLPRDAQDADLSLLFSTIEGVRDRAMFLLMLRCGLRVGEVRSLSLSDLYLRPDPGNLPRLWIHGKGGRERVVYLSEQALGALTDYLTLRPQVADDALFVSRLGKRLTVTAIQLRLAAHCHKIGLWLTCHQLRHTFGRHLVEAHVPLTSIQRLLGHARLRSTETYLHVSDPQVRADYEAAMAEVAERLALVGGEE